LLNVAVPPGAKPPLTPLMLGLVILMVTIDASADEASAATPTPAARYFSTTNRRRRRAARNMELLIERSPPLNFQSDLKTPRQPEVIGSADLLKPSIMRAGLWRSEQQTRP
jgi:hypothetical protein